MCAGQVCMCACVHAFVYEINPEELCFPNDLLCFSQGLGEAGMFLGSSVLFAIYDAVTTARKERGLSDIFPLNSPATPEVIRMACKDQFTDMVREVPTAITPYMDFNVLDSDIITMTLLQVVSIFFCEKSPFASTHRFLHTSTRFQVSA